MNITTNEIKNILFEKNEESSDNNVELGARVATNRNNVVSAETLRKVQSKTLNETKDFLSRTFGPMGSNTKIIRGENQQTVTSSYSKDGLHVLKNIINSGPIEASIVEELESITRAVEKEVGDGTTSTVILSAILFDKLTVLQKQYNIPPFRMSKLFQEVVDEIKEKILEDGRECTLDDIYDISMISTNGNEEVSNNIKGIYEQYGMNVDLSVGISNGTDSVLRSYDGLTITEGYSDPAFINNPDDKVCEIRDAHIYHFADPIDTPEMVSLFEAILLHNIYDPLEEDDEDNPVIPTVITCPRLSRDMSSIIKKLVEFLYQYSRENAGTKPPLLIITDVVASDEVIMDDIANLCDCKTIRKYIDPRLQQKDIEAGIAPTVENVWEFAGKAEVVTADRKKTKFINPSCMHEDNQKYVSLMNFLKNEIESAENTENANEVGKLKKRFNALNANMVDYLVGGVTVAERDMYKDLVEDAVKNCKSAALYGVGHAANFEGLINSYKVLDKYEDLWREPEPWKDDVVEQKLSIATAIFQSYVEISAVLYGTVEYDKKKVAEYIAKSIELEAPYNIANGYLPDIEEVSGDVLCSIKLDVQILDLVTKIISLMNSCNQCLLQASNLNVYELE